ncbi:hypothetical protein BTVI_71001 [Pitangus sulphuratus]|nr:hypothetical protein BTVI_71001 [Pitangus sulphuratus]
MPSPQLVHLGFSGSEAEHKLTNRLYEEQLVKFRLEKWSVRRTENWLNCQAERIAVSGMKYNWGLLSSSESQGLMQGPLLLNIFINHLNAGTECTLSKSADDTKLKEAADASEGCGGLQWDCKRLEKWADGNLTKFNQRKSKILPLGSHTPMPQ